MKTNRKGFFKAILGSVAAMKIGTTSETPRKPSIEIDSFNPNTGCTQIVYNVTGSHGAVGGSWKVVKGTHPGGSNQ